VDRRVDAVPWLSAGAVGLFSNDPLYLAGRSPMLASDPFAQRTFHHGHLASAVSNDRGAFYAPGAWGYPDTDWSYKGALQGWARPIGRGADTSVGSGSAGSGSVTFTVRMDSASTPSAWAGAFVCAPDDRSFDDTDEHDPGLGGYHVRLRHGVARLAARSSTSPIDPGGAATIRADITRGGVAATRLDTAPPITVGVADARHRGGYLHLGRRGAGVRFSGVTIA